MKLLTDTKFGSSAIIEILLHKLTSFIISKTEILALAQQVYDSVKGEIKNSDSDFLPDAISGLKLLVVRKFFLERSGGVFRVFCVQE